MDAVEKNQAFPLTVRSDLGNENPIVKNIQKALRAKYSESGRPPFLYGKSTANQKIESWWTMLRTHFTQFYMDTFKELQNDGYFEGSSIDKDLIRFCFLSLIQVNS